MKLIIEDNLNKTISGNYSFAFEIAEDSIYAIEIIASAKSWWQNAVSLRSFFNDDDLYVKIDDKEFPKLDGRSSLFDSEAAWNGNALKGLSKTGIFLIKLSQGKHMLNFSSDQKPNLEYIRISQLEVNENFTYIPTLNNPAQPGDRRPWISIAVNGLVIRQISIRAKAGKGDSDDDDIKLIIDGKIKTNATAKSHKSWFWCGKILNGKGLELSEEVNLKSGLHYIELWADGTPFLEKVEMAIKSDSVQDISVKRLKQYTYRGVSGQEDYNRYDDLIIKAVDYWNNEFFPDIYPPPVPLDPNLIKAMMFQESRVGHDPDGEINVMQVGKGTDLSLRILNGDSKFPEYEIKDGKLWQLDYKGKAKVIEVYDSIFWGTRWLFHKAQINGPGNIKQWHTWKEAVIGYGPPVPEYAENVWSIYLKGLDKRTKPGIKLWLLFLLACVFFNFSNLNHEKPLGLLALNAMDNNYKKYVNDVETTTYANDHNLFYAIAVREKDWWEDIKVGYRKDGQVKWLNFSKEPEEQFISQAKFINLQGFTNPLLEVYGQTHMWHGSYYLYEVMNGHLNLLLTTPAVDYNPDFSWQPDNFKKYGYTTCGQKYANGKLASRYEDLNQDGLDDLILSGTEEIVCEKGEVGPGRWDSTEIKVAENSVKKIFLWNEQTNNFIE